MPTPQYKKWDLMKGALSVNGAPIVGFQNGDIIAAEYTADRNTVHMSADNFGRLSQNPCKHGTVAIGLSDNSPAISQLQVLVDSGEPLVISYKDFTVDNGYVLAINCGIQKETPFTRALEIADRTWTFVTTALDYKHGSPLVQE